MSNWPVTCWSVSIMVFLSINGLSFSNCSTARLYWSNVTFYSCHVCRNWFEAVLYINGHHGVSSQNSYDMPWVLVFLDSSTVCDLNLREIIALLEDTIFFYSNLWEWIRGKFYDFFSGLKIHSHRASATASASTFLWRNAQISWYAELVHRVAT